MNCARCNKPLTLGTCDIITNPGATNPGADIHVCRGWCRSKPPQAPPTRDIVLTDTIPPLPRSRKRRRPRR